MRIDSNTSLQDLMDVAKKTITELDQGEEFLVKDLFRGFEWNRIGKGDRTKLGSMFYNYVLNHASTIINPLGKTAQNQQRYEKL
ncbi:single-stranded DNA-binding protein [Paenibacillus sp. 32352]|uniref:single-stranded DNA-binding protein n=1 Tax=Paenibacillus sp. 32352 TaxID=1969111 RepID=UPI0009AF19E6|nr:single-stranded DNA-binding protein [Paenibacillus sp. 32352]